MRKLMICIFIIMMTGCGHSTNIPDSEIKSPEVKESIKDSEILAEYSKIEDLEITFPEDIDYKYWSEGYSLADQMGMGLSKELQEKFDSIKDKINRNIHLTEDEIYFIVNVDTYKTFMKVSEVGVRIIKFDEKIIIEAEDAAIIRNVEVDLIHNTILTNYGLFSYSKPITVSDELFLKHGHIWELEEPYMNHNMKIYLGNIKNDNNTYIHIVKHPIEPIDKKADQTKGSDAPEAPEAPEAPVEEPLQEPLEEVILL